MTKKSRGRRNVSASSSRVEGQNFRSWTQESEQCVNAESSSPCAAHHVVNHDPRYEMQRASCAWNVEHMALYEVPVSIPSQAERLVLFGFLFRQQHRFNYQNTSIIVSVVAGSRSGTQESRRTQYFQNYWERENSHHSGDSQHENQDC